MGLTTSSTNGKPASVLPIVGLGEYTEVGCADLMIGAESDDDTGLFARIFYPSSQRSDTNEDPVVYPIWKPRKEYLDGLAGYREMSPRKLNLFFDWIVGERRSAAGWHEPLYSVHYEKERNNTSLHGSKSTGQLSHELNGVLPSQQNSTSKKPHLPQSQSENCLDEHDIKFPVLIFSHGIRDRSSCWTYSLETDALSGIVIEKQILMTTYPEGEGEFKRCNKQLHKRAVECVKALNVMEELNLGTCAPADRKPKGSKIVYGHNFDWTQFKDRLDIDKAAVIGHSFGAASAIAACCYSTDFVTCVSLDGWLFPLENDLYPRLTQNSLFLNASKWQWVENIKRMLKFENSLEQNIFTLNDIVHQSFSDFSFLSPGFVGRKFALQGDLDPLFTGEAVLELVVAHLRTAFKNQEPLIGHLREVVKKYEHFVVEGTELNLNEDEKDDNEQRTEAPTNVEFEPSSAELSNN